MQGMPMIYYGDEVGMTGGNDPDCRRGMLWDENLQDKDMLCWYRRLLKLRKERLAILSAETVSEEADDENGLIRITRSLNDQDITILFHAKEGDVQIPELAGKQDLLGQRVFEGTVQGITAMVLV
jgi:glycosidase